MNDPLAFLAREIVQPDRFTARNNSVNGKFNEVSFQNFYQQLEQQLTYQPQQSFEANYNPLQQNSMQNTTDISIASMETDQYSLQPLEALRQNLEQNYQNTEKALYSQQTEYYSVPDRNEEMQKRQQGEQEQAKETLGAKETKEVNVFSNHKSVSELEQFAQKRKILPENAEKKQLEKISLENKTDEQKNIKALPIDSGKLAKKIFGQNVEQTQIAAVNELIENKGKQNLQMVETNTRQKEASLQLQNKENSNNSEKTKLTVQVIDERLAAKPEQEQKAKWLESNRNIEKENSNDSLLKNTKQTDHFGESTKQLAQSELGSERKILVGQPQNQNKEVQASLDILVKPKSQSKSHGNQQNAGAKIVPDTKGPQELEKKHVHGEDYGYPIPGARGNFKNQESSNEILTAIAKDTPSNNDAKNLGKVAALRRQQSEGMQYAVSTDKQNSQLGNHQQNKEQSGFDFSQNLDKRSDSSILTETGNTSSQGNFHVNSNNPLRSLIQQMAQRLQEGPMAQNLRQLQFRLLDQNRGEIRLRLSPENLGQLRIHLNIDGGQISGRIVADNAEAARILQDNMQQLEASLREGGFENQGLNVSVGGGQSGNTDSENSYNGNQNSGNRILAANEENWENIGPSAEAILFQEQNQVDYSV